MAAAPILKNRKT